LSEILDPSPPLTAGSSKTAASPLTAGSPGRAASAWRTSLVGGNYARCCCGCTSMSGCSSARFLLVVAVTGLLYTLHPATRTDRAPPRADHRYRWGCAPAAGTRSPSTIAAVPDGTVLEIRPSHAPGGNHAGELREPVRRRRVHTRTAFVDPYNRPGSGACCKPTASGCRCGRGSTSCTAPCTSGPSVRSTSRSPASWLWVLVLLRFSVSGSDGDARARRVRRTLAPEGSARGRTRPAVRGTVRSGCGPRSACCSSRRTGLTWSQFAGANVTALRSAPRLEDAVGQQIPAGGRAGHARRESGCGFRAANPAAGPVAGPADGRARAADLVLASAPPPPGVLRSGGDHAGRPSRATAWVVEQTQRSWPEKQDSVAVDPGQWCRRRPAQVRRLAAGSEASPAGVSTRIWGLLFGVANQVLLAVLGPWGSSAS